MNSSIDDFVPHPVDVLERLLQEKEWSQRDFAEVIGKPVQIVSELMKKRKPLTAGWARSLEAAFEVPAQHWLNMEVLSKLASEKQVDPGISTRAKLFTTTKAPIADLRRRKWISGDSSPDLQRERLEKLLEPMQAAARKSQAGELNSSQWAWCGRAREIAETLNISGFSNAKLRRAIDKIRALTAVPTGVTKVADLLGEIGIRLVIVEHLPKSKIDGAAFWLTKAKPVIVLSLRFGRVDYFWFTLFHELAHIFNGDALSVDDDILSKDKGRDDIEKLADDQAAAWLVPQEELADFIRSHRRKISMAQVRQFAADIGVHSGIVLGQLQHKGKVPWSTGRKLLTPVRDLVVESCITDGWGKGPAI